jgi:hypothetical protein
MALVLRDRDGDADLVGDLLRTKARAAVLDKKPFLEVVG